MHRPYHLNLDCAGAVYPKGIGDLYRYAVLVRNRCGMLTLSRGRIRRGVSRVVAKAHEFIG